MIPTSTRYRLEAEMDAAEGSTAGIRFLNRELSWLDFNARVLALAEDPRSPLLERVKFLAISRATSTSSSRCAWPGLHAQVDAGVTDAVARRAHARASSSREIRMQVLEQLSRCRRSCSAQGARCPRSPSSGIRLVAWSELDDDERAHLAARLRGADLPGADAARGRPGAPVPVHLEPLAEPRGRGARSRHAASSRFARVKVPPLLPRFLALPDGERFVPIEQVIAAHLDALFPGMEIVSTTRSA